MSEHGNRGEAPCGGGVSSDLWLKDAVPTAWLQEAVSVSQPGDWRTGYLPAVSVIIVAKYVQDSFLIYLN